MQTALHVSDDTLIHHQEHTQTVITSGTGQTVFATVRWRGGVGTAVPTPPHQRKVANMVRPVPDVITVWVYSWWWMRVSSETCRAVCRKCNKTIYSRIFLDNYWHLFTFFCIFWNFDVFVTSTTTIVLPFLWRLLKIAQLSKFWMTNTSLFPMNFPVSRSDHFHIDFTGGISYISL